MIDDEFEFLGLDKKELLGVGNLAGHYANNKKLDANNKKLDSTNERLKDIQGRGPECPYCGGNLAHSKVKVCKHCGKAVVVDYGIAYTLQEIQALRAARKKADEEVQKLLTSISVAEPESVSQLYDRAIKIMEKVLDLNEVKRLKKKKESHFKWLARRHRRARQEELEAKYGKAQLKKEEKRRRHKTHLLVAPCYGLYAIPCWLLSLMGFEPWFWSSIPSWAHYSLLVGCPVLAGALEYYCSYRSKAERKAILLEKESKSESDNQKKAKNPWDIGVAAMERDKKVKRIYRMAREASPLRNQAAGKVGALEEGGAIEKKLSNARAREQKVTKKEDAQKQPEPISYYLKRGETIRGPLERAAVLQAAKGRMLMTGDQIANSKDGPWQDVTKEQLQQIQQGNDVEIK